MATTHDEIEALRRSGIFVRDGFVGAEAASAGLARLRDLPLAPAAVGRARLHAARGDRTAWVDDQELLAEFPFPITNTEMQRGRDRYNIYCTPCHGILGDGQGMVVQRGLRRAASYHQDRLRDEKVGYFFDVVTNGFGAMQGYAEQIPVRDRWLIVAYVRALQLSQHATMAEVPADRQNDLDNPPAKKSETAAAPH